MVSSGSHTPPKVSERVGGFLGARAVGFIAWGFSYAPPKTKVETTGAPKRTSLKPKTNLKPLKPLNLTPYFKSLKDQPRSPKTLNSTPHPTSPLPPHKAGGNAPLLRTCQGRVDSRPSHFPPSESTGFRTLGREVCG